MRINLFPILLGLLLSIISGCAASSESILEHDKAYGLALFDPDENVELEGVSLADRSNVIDKIANGWPVGAFYWATTLQFGKCTGTLIGPQVLVTAAHCVDARNRELPAETRSVTINWFDWPIPATCRMAPAYSNAPLRSSSRIRHDFDIAICKLHLSVFDFERRAYEDLGTVPIVFPRAILDGPSRPLSVKTTLSGFGCHKLGIKRTTFLGRERYSVDKLSTEYSDPPNVHIGYQVAKIFPTRYKISINSSSEAATLCMRDSGGALYLNELPGDFSDGKSRSLLAINSSIVLPRPKNSKDDIRITSQFAALNTGQFSHFLGDWLSDQENSELRVCVKGGSNIPKKNRLDRCEYK